MDTQTDLEKRFNHLVDKFSGYFSESLLQSLHTDAAAGEMPIGFGRLLYNLEELEIIVDNETRKELHYIATALGCLDHPAGRGIYW